MAIGMTLKKAAGKYDLGASKFFGIPTIPGDWVEGLDDNLLFLAQIRLADLAGLDKENRLPHTGYLYFFVDSQAHMGEEAEAVVLYSPEEPDTAVEAFNDDFAIAGTAEDWFIEFREVEEDADGNKLLGDPSGWDYEDSPRLLLQYDPLATEGIAFMDAVDGFGFFFFGEASEGFEKVVFRAERS